MSDLDPFRLLRLRSEESPTPASAVRRLQASTPRLIGQVINQGAMPSQTERVFLVNQAWIDGAEVEAGNGSLITAGTEADRTVPVVVIGSRPPVAGDVLIALSLGGRWVAESGEARGSLDCWPCAIPRKDLTLSWANSVIGHGSVTLAYEPPARWVSECFQGLMFWLACTGSIVRFGASYFVSGECPSGQHQDCTSTGSPPFSLRLVASTCEPFYFKYVVDSSACPFLVSGGYASLTITE